MALKFLKVNPEKALEVIRKAIITGYELKEFLYSDYGSGDNNGAKLSSWNTRNEAWKKQTFIELSKIYAYSLEPENFKNFRALDVQINMLGDFGSIIINLEGKITYLNQLYQFIFQHSNITINAEGDVIFQYGNNLVAEINK